MLDELKKLLPEAEKIQDSELLQSTLQCFADGLRAGGWTPEDMKRIPATLLIPDCPFSFLDHTRAVTNCAEAVASRMKEIYGDAFSVDMDVIIAGGLLHDVGKLMEIQKDPSGGFRKSDQGKILRHPISGTALAAKRNIPDSILHIIACHSREGDAVRRSTEAVIIHHADFSNFEPFKP